MNRTTYYIHILKEEYVDRRSWTHIFKCIFQTLTRKYPQVRKPAKSNINFHYNNIYIKKKNSIILTNQYKIVFKPPSIVSPAAAKGQPFPDVLLYVNTSPNLDIYLSSCPDHVIELTKNDKTDSGNMCYQRLEKFVYIFSKYGFDTYNQMDKTLLYVVYNKKPKKCNSVTWNISKRLAKTENINVIEDYTDGVVYNDLEPYNSVFEIAKHINSTKMRKGTAVNNRLMFNTENELVLDTNLIHCASKEAESVMHDPNTGFVCALAHVICCRFKNTLSINTRLYEKQLSSKSKLWTCLYSYRDQITLFDKDGRVYNKDWELIDMQNHLNTPYFKFSTSEKTGTINLHYQFEDKVIFSNHAGCEKSNIRNPFTGDSYQSERGKGLPDLIMVDLNRDDNTLKRLIVIEGEQNSTQNIIKGTKQIVNDFPAWIQKNIKDKWTSVEWTNVEVCYVLTTYGGTKHPPIDTPYLGYSMLENREEYVNPEIFTF